MNTVTGNNISAGTDRRCVFVPKANSSLGVPAPANFNFNLQPYKFAAANGKAEIGIDERAELNRFIAFGKSLAGAASGLY